MPTTPQIGIREFRGNISTYLHQARQGASFLITSHGEIIAELHPPSPAQLAPRSPGALRGKIRLTPDFDTLPEDILSVIETGDV